MEKSQEVSPVQTQTSTVGCFFPGHQEYEEGQCPCFDDFGECKTCGACPGVACDCPEEPWEFEPDPEEEAAFLAWQEEICKEGEEAERVLKPFLQKYLPKEIFSLLAGPCPDTPTLHVVFCRSCLEELRILGRADEVEYEYPT